MWKRALKSKQKIPKWIEADDLPLDVFANMATIWEQFHELKDDPHVLEKLGTHINSIATKINHDKKEKEITSLERQARAAAIKQLSAHLAPSLASSPVLLSSSTPLSPTVTTVTSTSTSTYQGRDTTFPDTDDFRELLSQHPNVLRSVLHANNQSSAPPPIMNYMMELLGVKDKLAGKPSDSAIFENATGSLASLGTSIGGSDVMDFNMSNLQLNFDDLGLSLSDMDNDISAAAMMAVAEALKSVMNSEDVVYVSDATENNSNLQEPAVQCTKKKKK